jgi:predicted acetyltransferase
VWRSGADPVLVTCDEDNRGSRAVIERVGGRFVRTVAGEGPVTKRHYEFRRDPG